LYGRSNPPCAGFCGPFNFGSAKDGLNMGC
jgi:hypothetical protein